MALAAPLFIALALLCTYIGYLILQRTLHAWLQPFLQWLFAPRQAFWKRALLWPVQEIGRGFRAVVRYVSRILGGAFYLAGARLASFFAALGYTESLLTLTIQRAVDDLVSALVFMRNVAVPKLISAQLAPVLARANAAYNLASAATTTLTGVSTEFAAGLRSLPWGVPLGLPARVAAFFNAFEQLWDKVWKDVVPQLNLLRTTTVPRISARVDDIWDDLYRSGVNSLPRIRQRLGQLEAKLGDIGSAAWWQAGVSAAIAAIVGITAAAALVGIRTLFCRNNLAGARNLCAAPPGYIDELLAVFFAVEAIENLPTLVRIMQGVARETTQGLADLAGV